MKKLHILIVVIFAFSFLKAQESNFVKPGTAESFKNNPVNVVYSPEALLFQDDFNGDNSVAGLEARGYVVIDADGGGIEPPWFQGDPNAFPAFEGLNNGYVASNFQGANGLYIDQWLISPIVGVSSGDSLTFYHRSPDGNQWDDSLYVKVAPNGGTNISDFTISSPRFLAGENGWEQYTYIFTVTSFVRFAIQYQIFSGGVNGNYSNYIGIDFLQVYGQGSTTPVELTSFTAIENEGTVELSWITATETNNKGFEVERSQDSGVISREKIGFINGKGTTTEPTTYSFTDNNIKSGTYSYRLKQMDFDGTYEYSSEVEVTVDFTPKEFALEQNYPNPFNPTTAIKYSIPVDGIVTLTVYNALGEKVAELVNGDVKAGSYEINFDASALSSGIYFYKLKSGNFTEAKKMLLLK